MTDQPPNRRLYKDPTNKKIAGVASGMAKYFGLDPTVVRLIWALTVLAGGTGIIVYIAFAIILEDEPQPTGD